MADLAASIAKARKAGYSDAEIAAYIAKDPTFGPKVQRARKSGYNDAQIVAHLGKVNRLKDAATSFVSGAREGASSIADMVAQGGPMGVVDSYLKAGASVAQLARGKASPLSNPFSAYSDSARRQGYKPQTTAGEYARTVGQMLPNAMAPGSTGARVANVFAPALASETSGQIARRMGAGPTGEAVARTLGAVGGSAVASMRPQNLFDRRETPPVATVGLRAKQDPAAMRQRAQEFRDAGIDPTLADVVDDAGRGVIRASANRPTEARQAANDFARSRALNLPGRISKQARDSLSRDPRTPDQIRAAEVAKRSANADQAFGAVRGDQMQMAPETVQALRTDYGRGAISEAAARERDPEVKAALLRLANAALDDPSTPITVGMADRISRVLFGKAQAATRTGDNDLAATLNGLAASVRDPARSASPGYGQALQQYAADSRLAQAADVGEQFMTRNTDEFVAAAGKLEPRERALAAAAARRAIERKAGENVSSAPSVARAIADAPEQQARNAALLGPDRAQRLQGGMRLEARAVENASAIAPRSGSTTFLNAADEANASQALSVGRQIMNRDFAGLAAKAYDRFRSRGLSDQQAEQVVRMAIDPNQTDAAIQAIAQRLAPAERQEFLALRNAALVSAGAATLGARPISREDQQ